MPSSSRAGATLASLHLHPVKSLRAVDAASAVVQPWGLLQDRRWMLVDADGRLVSQREQPRLALLRAVPDPAPGADVDGLLLSGPHAEDLRVAPPSPLRGDPLVPVHLFSSSFEATEAGKEAHLWFSDLLGADLRLVHLDDPLRRSVDPAYGPGRTVSMADGYPLLVTTTGSLAALNEAIAADRAGAAGTAPAPLPMNRFRPNLVIDGTAPWAEDGWRRIRVGDVVFHSVKPCGRCVVTTIDQHTAERRGPEPLRALARHHRIGKALAFGQNLLPELPEGLELPCDAAELAKVSLGVLRVGDPVTVLD